MRLRLFILLVAAIVLVVACQGPPSTVVYIVLSPTPPGGDAAAVNDTGTAAGGTPGVEASPMPTLTPTITPTLDPFPTPVIGRIQVAEQLFEHGRIYWLRPRDELWVMVETADGQLWRVFDDNFVEGDLEFDPEIEAPEGLYQPIRGFGQLWRENPEVREALGWALEPEVGFVTDYEYHAGGEVTAANEYVFGVGYHILVGSDGHRIRFDEATFTWTISN